MKRKTGKGFIRYYLIQDGAEIKNIQRNTGFIRNNYNS